MNLIGPLSRDPLIYPRQFSIAHFCDPVAAILLLPKMAVSDDVVGLYTDKGFSIKIITSSLNTVLFSSA